MLRLVSQDCIGRRVNKDSQGHAKPDWEGAWRVTVSEFANGSADCTAGQLNKATGGKAAPVTGKVGQVAGGTAKTVGSAVKGLASPPKYQDLILRQIADV